MNLFNKRTLLYIIAVIAMYIITIPTSMIYAQSGDAEEIFWGDDEEEISFDEDFDFSEDDESFDEELLSPGTKMLLASMNAVNDSSSGSRSGSEYGSSSGTYSGSECRRYASPNDKPLLRSRNRAYLGKFSTVKSI